MLYDAQKLEKIKNIKTSFTALKKDDLTSQYQFYQQLYEEYKIFNFDTAYVYAGKMHDIAMSLGDPPKIIEAKIKLLFVLVSAGMYKEAYELINQINVAAQADSVKANYFFLKARFYFDLADYVNDEFHKPAYNRNGNDNLDSALLFYPPNSFESIYYSGLKNLKNDRFSEASANFQTLLNGPGLTYHQIALVSSTLSHIFLRQGERNTAIDYQIRAAINDIKSSTKETFAILNLAQLLFEEGNFKNASFYIEKAIDDATFYGARQRKVQVSTIMPIIQSSRINFIEGQRRLWIIYGSVVSGILILLIFLIVVIYRQNRKLENARKVISVAHGKLSEVNSKLHEVNLELHDVNSRLSEANKIKEEYIGYFFRINSGTLQKIERLKSSIEQKLRDRRLDDIRVVVGNINIHNEKQELLKSFDKAFLKIFPHFVEEFNSLFEEEDQVKLSDDELLTTDLRIYALIRLGIKDNEKIAEILEYSVKSIYAYKTKMRNRSKLHKEDFDKRIMSIKSL
jgi:tetratricopeptide (TPR) repeat protein